MKSLFLLTLLLVLNSCEFSTMRWGYYWNPERVLSIAHEAVKEGDLEKWFSVTKDFPYCKYGSKDGLKHIKHIVPKEMDELDVIELNKIQKNNQTIYEVEVQSKKNAKTLSLVEITCITGDKSYCDISNIQFPNALPFTGNDVCDHLQKNKL